MIESHHDVEHYYQNEPAPDLPEVQQREPEAPPLIVEHAGPVHMIDLPSRIGTSANYGLGQVDPVPLVGRDPRRRRMLITSTVDYFVGPRDAVMAGTAAKIVVAQVPLLDLRSTEQVYALADTTDGIISVITENWAD